MGIGRVELAAAVSGIHLDLETEELQGWLESVSLHVRDTGGVTNTLEQLAAQQGMEPEQMRQLLLEQIGQVATGFLGDPARAGEIVTAMTSFLAGGRVLQAALEPPEPVPFAAVPELAQQGAADVLGLVVAAAEPRDTALPPLPEVDPTSPPEVLAAAATAYANGIGVPQNFARALELAERAAQAGDPQGMVLQARLLTDYATDPERRGEAYRLASLAAAAGEPDGAVLASKLESGMSAAAVAAAQASALASWRERDPDPRIAELETTARLGDTAAMRDLAQAFLTASGAPKSYAEAYVWASLAAAYGDPVAAALRERIVGAVRLGAVPSEILTDSQGRAAELWEELRQR
jgi:hypothetical protein